MTNPIDITNEMLQAMIAEEVDHLEHLGGDATLGMIDHMFGEGVGGGVKEISRRRLAAAIFATTDRNTDPDYAVFGLTMARAEYEGFGGNPGEVRGDWVQAFDPVQFWRPVPAETARWDAVENRWISSWVDPVADGE